jgi:hypothetical protein
MCQRFETEEMWRAWPKETTGYTTSSPVFSYKCLVTLLEFELELNAAKYLQQKRKYTEMWTL